MMKLLVRIALLFLLSVVSACGTDPKTETSGEGEERAVSVEVAVATEGDLSIDRSIFARTAPNQATPILLSTPGEVDSLEVSNGDFVEEDDIIASVLSPTGKQTLRAPVSGEIVRLTAAVGDIITAEEPLAMIADLKTMKLEFAVTAGIRELFSTDQSFPATINGETYQAKITEIDTLPNETGLYPVAAVVENEAGTILPGVVVELIVPEQQMTNALIVPTSSIVTENDETFVYVVQGERAVKKVVNVLMTQSKQSAIEGEVQVGDSLVVTGQFALSNDTYVKVVKGEET